MILAKRGDRTYEITAEDQLRVVEIMLATGCTVRDAVETMHREKFGEPFRQPKEKVRVV